MEPITVQVDDPGQFHLKRMTPPPTGGMRRQSCHTRNMTLITLLAGIGVLGCFTVNGLSYAIYYHVSFARDGRRSVRGLRPGSACCLSDECAKPVEEPRDFLLRTRVEEHHGFNERTG